MKKTYILFISNIHSITYLGCAENNNEIFNDMETNQMVCNTLVVAQDKSNSPTENLQTNVHLTKHKETVQTVEIVEANFDNVNLREAESPTKALSHPSTSHIIKNSTSLRCNNIWSNRKSWQKDVANISIANRKLINYYADAADGEYFFLRN